ncbi:MAG TPA: hypothetical protein VF597_00740 [Candidatus Saccharimonadales bacterium]|jgi:hypothetical protein
MLFPLLKWWYTAGWLDQVDLVRIRIENMADLFSLELSLKSLFAPFRQIDAEPLGRGPLSLQLRSLFDQLFSRIFGAIIRCVFIIIGGLVIQIEAWIGAIRLLVWPWIPFLPIIAIIPTLIGWVPWR